MMQIYSAEAYYLCVMLFILVYLGTLKIKFNFVENEIFCYFIGVWINLYIIS